MLVRTQDIRVDERARVQVQAYRLQLAASVATRSVETSNARVGGGTWGIKATRGVLGEQASEQRAGVVLPIGEAWRRMQVIAQGVGVASAR